MMRSIAALAAALLLAAGLPGSIPGQPSGERSPAATGQSTDLAQARELLRRGEYEEALAALEELATTGTPDPSVRRVYARGLMEVGRYEEALGMLRRGREGDVSAELANVVGEIHLATGRLGEAEAAFRRSMKEGAEDGNVARLNLGILLWHRGDREEALSLFDSFIDLYNRARDRLTAEELMAVGTAVRYLGVRNPSLYQDALMAFDDAAEVDPGDPRPDLLAGQLFLEKYRATDARESFRPVLDRNPRHPVALLGQAKILDFEGTGGSVALVRQALEVNPAYADAHAFLASVYLKTEDFGRSRVAARRALEANPAHLDALSVMAAGYYLAGDSGAYEETRERIRTLNPAYPGLYLTLAQQLAAQRQYERAVWAAEEAVSRDSSSWWSYGVLGMNQLRTGAVEEGRRNLEVAFAGDPFNPWYKNTLDLLDTFVRYETIPTDHFEIFLHQDEAELLGPYVAATAEEAYAALLDRYGTRPPTPIRLELYPSHDDFSVRTLGLTGLGALGVSFGSTLVMDSPSALDPGNFNWASTLWHEVAHAFHLAMTDHQVPRWFTEGLAVHEQRKARAGWGHKASPDWLRAYDAGRMPPVSRLNEGFIRPEYPDQVVHSYYQASLVFQLIEERWGLEAILAMLENYHRGRSNSEVFEEVLGQTPEAFDKTFHEYVQERWGSRMRAVSLPDRGEGITILHQPGAGVDALRLWVLEDPNNFLARLSLGKALFDEGRYDEAEGHLQAAANLFPEYGGEDGPFVYLARIHGKRGDSELEVRALQRLGSLNETLHDAHLRAAELWLKLGDPESAMRALERVVEVVPFEMDVHERLAELYEGLGDHEGAVRERRAILALGPVDEAEAHYRLALALYRWGDQGEAKRHLLRALEIAPSYEPALELLLTWRGEGKEEGS